MNNEKHAQTSKNIAAGVAHTLYFFISLLLGDV